MLPKRDKPYHNNLKYWRNQTPPPKGKLFEDPFFPPNKSSLEGLDKNGKSINQEKIDENKNEIDEIKELTINWKRASEIFKDRKYFLFEDKIEIYDLRQGDMGDCYFISSCAAMTKYPSMIYQMFKTKEINEEGYFEVILFIDGIFQIVIVDDYLPVKKNGHLAFAKSRNHELWVCILEKAWAKIHGGYFNIIGGRMQNVLNCFTGFRSGVLFSNSFDTPDLLFNELEKANKKDCILTCVTKDEANNGLVKKHAYTIMDTVRIKSGTNNIKLIKIFNPYGYVEWKGDWSDDSPLWGPEEKAQVDFVNKDDGIFFMSVSDFKNMFETSEICYVLYDCYSKIFKIDGPNLRKGNVFNIYLDKNAQINISLIKKSKIMHPELKNFSFPTYLGIVKFDPRTREFMSFSSYDAISKIDDNCSLTKKLKKGFYLIYAYHDIYNSKVDSYVVKIDSTVRFKCEKMPVDGRRMGYPLLREIAIQTVKNLNKEKKDGIISYSREIKKGDYLGHFIEFNNSKKWLVLKGNSKSLQNMELLFPYKMDSFFIREKFILAIPPGETGCILGLYNNDKGGEISFKIDIESSYSETKPNDSIKEGKINYKDYINCNVSKIDSSNDSFYDFISMSLTSAKKELSFDKLKSDEEIKKKLKEEYPELMKKLFHLLKETNEKKEGLTWCKEEKEYKIYVGQKNENTGEKKGIGAMINNDGYDNEVQIGYFIDNKINGKGFIYSDVNLTKPIYEGEFIEGEKSGYGVFYEDEGGKYEGNFANDVKNGKGTYYWFNGGKWEGNFTDDKMNGIGIFTDSENNQFNAEYVMDEIVNQ